MAMIPGASRVPVIGSGQRGRDVPDTALVLESVNVDRERLASYDRVCGFPLRDQLPCTYPHVLAFPLHLQLMTDPAFPFPALGLVHIENAIVQHRPIVAGETLDLRVWATPLEAHSRGRQFALRSEARVGDELVWEETSTILRREARASGERPVDEGPGDGEGPGEGEKPAVGEPDQLPVTATWRLPGDLGRRYGSVSGDMNPIHIHPVTARLFGFPTAIAHGMWTKARCLAALGPHLPDSFSVEVSF
ncbi:MAG TPA: MaoC/PaaZ C-terminal domain-containing protein, partial [Solirubrobacteraceae bacterium]|nr:MaoC/PaaZ C-terminal domain-containing protein [Solirubrobacteraceae bacterium]